MDSINFIALILYILILFITLASAQQLFCYETGNFTTNSTYAQNRGRLLSALASNITENISFYTTSVGQGSDTVYGLVLCRVDSSSEACSNCVNYGIQNLISNCPNQKEAISWGGGTDVPPCIIRYANRYIVGRLELDPSNSGYNVDNLPSNIGQFDEIWSSLMERVGTKASMGSSKIKFATGEANYTTLQTIYVMMQCTPDLSQSYCSYCLQQAVGDYRACCLGKRGGYVLKPSCWFRWDLYPFYESTAADAPQASLPPPPTTTVAKGKRGIQSGTVVITVVPAVSFLLLVTFMYILFRRRKPRQRRENVCEGNDESTAESLQFDIEAIRVATNNFSGDNKLGEGGFGTVYKGRLPDGPAIAVKRWSRNSSQGEVEFKNEVLLVAMLQHRNLVRLLGFCLQEREKLLIYEFVPNLSLDHYIFDSIRRLLLDWNKRYKIIEGIARGILYLHQDSRTRIIHRDLKASNILLDEQMNPKISDFGIARLLPLDQSQDATRRIMGTYGYMPPEYAMHGRFSMKSDVFSFGVLVLEIMSGQKVSCFRNGEVDENLFTYAWRSWNEGTPLNLIDAIPLSVGSRNEMIRCIHVGLLCVQEDVTRRPAMDSVILMLSSHSVSLPLPSRPAYFMHSIVEEEPQASPPNPEMNAVDKSRNEVSLSEQVPR
ncbi:cysteine-rich receptor-like protein kinase 44 [Hevea brasiliensis]|uniref:cysteine-rich receptor-like protein kinase 44 n=1 Tax=Hevea brasiliensis TaxID=3981 RepID=UPI0025E017AD|nr:cysteine-rich receptor-like protein kinase 44 [Hevea brasiliensis]